jgi:hypothetical protein
VDRSLDDAYLSLNPSQDTTLLNYGLPGGSLPISSGQTLSPATELVTNNRPQDQPTATPGQLSQTSQGTSTTHRAAYLGDSGYMSIFSHEMPEDHSSNPQEQIADHSQAQLSPALQESYLDTYFRYCYTWCPIFDRNTFQACPEFSNSQLLREALALLGSQLSPPLIPHKKPSEHFHRFRQLFYSNHEKQPLVRICAVMLIYWWSSGPPNVVSIDTNWWWMGASIRLAQEIGLHRDHNAGRILRTGETEGLAKRIWWTLFVSKSYGARRNNGSDTIFRQETASLLLCRADHVR